MQKLLMDPKYWLDRAEELRSIAEQIDDPRARSAMLAVATDCDRLAEHAVRLAASDKQGSFQPCF